MRLFVGIALLTDIALRLAALCSGVAGARWVSPENMHVTLRFIGDVNGGDSENLNGALADISCPPFSLSLTGVDYFRKSRECALFGSG